MRKFLAFALILSISSNTPVSAEEIVTLRDIDLSAYKIIDNPVCGPMRTWNNGGWLFVCDLKSGKMILKKKPSKLPAKKPETYFHRGNLVSNGTSVPNTSSSQSGSKQTTSSQSEAEKLKNRGCSAFPSAIIRLQNTTGSTYNKAVVSAQEASFHIIDAAQLDKKYDGLRNAQRIIAQYVQDVGWGGKGYFGDINTVRTAIATFNMACNSNLSIG